MCTQEMNIMTFCCRTSVLPKEPGSNNHWSDAVRSEYGNYMVMSSNTFDTRYGDGASAIAGQLMSDPATFAKWQQGLTSVDKIQEAGGYWSQQAYTTKYSGPGSITLNGVDYKIQPATGGVSNKWISVNGGRLSGGGANASNREFIQNERFNNDEKASLGLAAISGSVQVTTELINRLSGTVKNADIVNFGNSVTKKFGLVGVVLTIYSVSSDGITKGDATRILLSGATLLPYVGWAYGAIDIGFLLVTETSLTDRAGAFVDEQWGSNPINLY